MISDLINNISQRTKSHKDLDYAVHHEVANEIKQGDIDEALWIKALEQAKGDEKYAQAKYIKLRVASIKSEFFEWSKEQQEQRRAESQRSSNIQAAERQKKIDERESIKSSIHEIENTLLTKAQTHEEKISLKTKETSIFYIGFFCAISLFIGIWLISHKLFPEYLDFIVPGSFLLIVILLPIGITTAHEYCTKKYIKTQEYKNLMTNRGNTIDRLESEKKQLENKLRDIQ